MAGRLIRVVPRELDGERVDKAVAVVLELSRAHAKELLKEGVTLDGVPVKAADRVKAGGSLDVAEPRFEGGLEPEPLAFDVLYEDPALIVVDKPAGVVVHPGSGRKKGTLAAGLLHRYPDLEGVGQADRWGLVHRLDRDTSGVLVVARTSAAYAELTQLIRKREVTRSYTALVGGLFGSPTGTIEAPIGRDPARPTQRAVTPGGKDARTHYEVEESFPLDECTLLSVRLETGRTHQIRVHLATIDHPVVGDRTYGRQTVRIDTPRIFLHAKEVAFFHPETGGLVEVEAPLPLDLRSVLDRLAARSQT